MAIQFEVWIKLYNEYQMTLKIVKSHRMLTKRAMIKWLIHTIQSRTHCLSITTFVDASLWMSKVWSDFFVFFKVPNKIDSVACRWDDHHNLCLFTLTLIFAIWRNCYWVELEMDKIANTQDLNWKKKSNINLEWCAKVDVVCVNAAGISMSNNNQ